MQDNMDPNQGQYQTPPSNGKAVASLVLGIVAIASIFIPSIGGFIGIVAAIVGLVLSIQAKKVQKSGMATAGMVLCIIAIAIDVLAIVACASLLALIGMSGAML